MEDLDKKAPSLEPTAGEKDVSGNQDENQGNADADNDASKEDASQNNQNQDNGSDTKTETKPDPKSKTKATAKAKEPAAPAAPAEAVEMVKVTLVDRTAPYRRAGILFAERITEIPKADLTKEQVERLTKDPALKVDGI